MVHNLIRLRLLSKFLVEILLALIVFAVILFLVDLSRSHSSAFFWVEISDSVGLSVPLSWGFFSG